MKQWAAGPPLNQLLLAQAWRGSARLWDYEPLSWDQETG